jgi:hypothetical protein
MSRFMCRLSEVVRGMNHPDMTEASQRSVRRYGYWRDRLGATWEIFVICRTHFHWEILDQQGENPQDIDVAQSSRARILRLPGENMKI